MPAALPDRYTTLARELIVALRGRRSQTGFSRALGYRSNIVGRWEAEHSWPTAARFLAICARLGVDLHQVFRRFFGRAPSWLEGADAAAPSTVAAFLRDLRGRTPIQTLARASGVQRFTVSRWLQGTAQPRLPEFLMMIELSSRRLIDFLACVTDPARLPSVADDYRRLEAAREAAYESPWSHGVLRALELGDSTARAGDEEEWLARRLGIERAEVERALAALVDSGQVHRRDGRLRLERMPDVDTGKDPQRARALKQVWTEVALRRLARGAPGLYGYTVFAISRHDLQRLREVQLEYLRQMQSIIAGSSQGDCVALYCAQLLDLADDDQNALRDDPAPRHERKRRRVDA